LLFTLIDEAVELVSAVTTVIVPVTQQRLVDTVPVAASVHCVVTFLLCFGKRWRTDWRMVQEEENRELTSKEEGAWLTHWPKSNIAI
jgi:hypothetical protein